MLNEKKAVGTRPTNDYKYLFIGILHYITYNTDVISCSPLIGICWFRLSLNSLMKMIALRLCAARLVIAFYVPKENSSVSLPPQDQLHAPILPFLTQYQPLASVTVLIFTHEIHFPSNAFEFPPPDGRKRARQVLVC